MTGEQLKSIKKNGFTLMEVMIAITVLFVGAVGLATLLNYTVVNVSANTNQLIAANLAQEGIEAVRHNRDSNDNWNPWYNSVDDGEHRAEIDMSEPYDGFVLRRRVTSLPEDFFPLYYNDALGIYNHVGVGSKTIFNRKITITELSSTEKKVVTEVWWTDRGKTYSFSIENRLHYWWYK
jgi:prepilin-type N-terminal cleavage/methylation domain-containing protein